MSPPGPYRIQITSEAHRGLHRLPAKAAAAVVEFVTGPLADHPAPVSKPLTGELASYRSARRGDYRILVRIDGAARAMLVARVEHRADVYRPQ